MKCKLRVHANFRSFVRSLQKMWSSRKDKPGDEDIHQAGLANTTFSTDYAQNNPKH